MKKLLMIAALFSTALFSCKKEELDDIGNKKADDYNAATLVLVNNSKNPYAVSGTAGYIYMAGKETKRLNVTKGVYYLTAEQQDGYLIYPTVVEKTLNIRAGKTESFVFP